MKQRDVPSLAVIRGDRCVHKACRLHIISTFPRHRHDRTQGEDSAQVEALIGRPLSISRTFET